MKWLNLVLLFLGVVLVLQVANAKTLDVASKSAVVNRLISPKINQHTFENCVKSLMANGISEAKAMEICGKKLATITQTNMNKCVLLRDKMEDLTRKIEENPSSANIYLPALKKLEMKFKEECTALKKSTKIVIPENPCEEYRIIVATLNRSNQIINELQSMEKAGVVNSSEIELLKRYNSFVKNQLPFFRIICIQKRTIAPCKHLYVLQRVRDHLIQLKSFSNNTERLDQSIDELNALIDRLKKKCYIEPLSEQVQEAEDLSDLSDIYEGKINSMIQNATNQTELIQKLRKIQEEKRKLIRSFIRRMRKLELERQAIIRRVVIGRNVSVDGIPANVSEIVVKLGNQSVVIHPGNTIKISVGNETAEASITLEWVNGSLVDPETNKTIKILPVYVKKKLRKAIIRRMILKRIKNKPVYEVDAVRKGRFLGFIPVTFSIKQDVDATSGKIVAVVKPWWSFLVS